MNKITRYITLSALVATAFTSCGLYSSYERNENIEELDELYSYIEATNQEESIASLSWRELFTDPHLQSLIESGLERNTDLSIAQLSVEQGQASLRTARLSMLPSLNFGPNAAISSSSGTTTKSYNVPLSASWEVDIFGRLRNVKEQNKAALEQSIAYRQVVQTQLIASIAESYYSLLMLDEQLEISLQTQTNWEENLRVMNAMKRAGRITETSVLQSEASSVALSQQIVTLKEQIAAMENSISLLLAQPTKSIERGSIDDIDFPSYLAIGVPLDLLSNRPDIKVVESSLAQAFYATAEARSSLYPSLTLGGSAGYTYNSASILDPGAMIYNATASLLQPIFNGGALRAELKISKAQQEKAQLEFTQAVLDAGAEVNNALSEWQSSQQRLELGATQIELLDKALSKTETMMKYGSANYLEVLTAQLSLLQTQLSYSSDKYNQAQGVISLYRALGGGAE